METVVVSTISTTTATTAARRQPPALKFEAVVWPEDASAGGAAAAAAPEQKAGGRGRRKRVIGPNGEELPPPAPKKPSLADEMLKDQNSKNDAVFELYARGLAPQAIALSRLALDQAAYVSYADARGPAEGEEFPPALHSSHYRDNVAMQQPRGYAGAFVPERFPANGVVTRTIVRDASTTLFIPVLKKLTEECFADFEPGAVRALSEAMALFVTDLAIAIACRTAALAPDGSVRQLSADAKVVTEVMRNSKEFVKASMLLDVSESAISRIDVLKERKRAREASRAAAGGGKRPIAPRRKRAKKEEPEEEPESQWMASQAATQEVDA
jgi:hypothetical protein